ncbi:MAG: ribosome maturation factor [Deltaproteobacteria bacterium]|jgi:ribosome maturation factor RimP|nr:ribosome maturation factor [Deltaproteobacteria bacterium]
MNETGIADSIAAMAAPLAASLDLSIWGVEAAFGKRGLVRVFVEGKNGVDIDACAELSRLLGLSLDVEDLLPGAYVLEVSSPGLERRFFTAEQLGAALGDTVEVTLHAPAPAYPGRKKLLGELVAVNGGLFSLLPLENPSLAAGGERIPALFAWDDIKMAARVHFLPEPSRPAKGRAPKQRKKPDTPAAAAPRDGAGEDPAV